MKIDNSHITPARTLPGAPNPSGKKGKTSEAQKEPESVEMKLSGRNQTRVSDTASQVAAFNSEAIQSVTASIRNDPGTAVLAQSNTSPERVLQLLD